MYYTYARLLTYLYDVKNELKKSVFYVHKSDANHKYKEIIYKKIIYNNVMLTYISDYRHDYVYIRMYVLVFRNKAFFERLNARFAKSDSHVRFDLGFDIHGAVGYLIGKFPRDGLQLMHEEDPYFSSCIWARYETR